MCRTIFRSSAAAAQTIARVAIAASMLFTWACGSSSETVTIPSPSRCAVQTKAERLSFAPDGGSGTISISTNRECTWSVRSEAAWVSLAPPVTGQGDGSVQFTVAANADPAARAAAMSIEDQRLQVSQEGRRCEFRLSSTDESVDPSGGERTIQVSTGSAQCGWTASSDAPWITIVAGREGSGNGSVTFRVDAMRGPPRSGAISVAGQAVEVEQGSGCSYGIGTATFSFGAGGGTSDVPVSAPAGCSWSAATDTPWITIASGTTGTGAGSVRFRVAATDGPARTGTLTVAGQAVTVTQTPGCTYGIEPSSYAAPQTGGAAAIAVRAAAGCAWAASSSADWISITAGQAGNGAGEVRFSVAPNAAAARTGSLRVGDQTVTVTQGAGCTFSVSPGSVSAGAPAGTGTVQVTVAQGCTWAATSGAPWLTITVGASGNGSGQVQYAVAANSGPARSASLSIEGQTVEVAQASGCTYNVGPAAQDVPGAGASGAVSIATAAGCPWVASSNASWITVAAPSGSGPGQVPFTVASNQAPARVGTISIAGQLLTLNQASSCTWMLAPPSHAFDANGGNGNVLVIVSGPCTWTAASDVDWISMTAGTAGTGDGLVQFVAAPNNGPARSGSVTIAGQRYPVTESGR
jgi:hypothetical protein